MDVTEQIGATESSLLDLIMKKYSSWIIEDRGREIMFLLFEMNGGWEKQNVFLKSQRCFIFIKQGIMSSADFRRIKSVHVLFFFFLFLFLKSDAIYVTMRKKQEILFNFWLAEKIQKHEIDFSNQRRRERKRKVEVGEIAS